MVADFSEATLSRCVKLEQKVVRLTIEVEEAKAQRNDWAKASGNYCEVLKDTEAKVERLTTKLDAAVADNADLIQRLVDILDGLHDLTDTGARKRLEAYQELATHPGQALLERQALLEAVVEALTQFGEGTTQLEEALAALDQP